MKHTKNISCFFLCLFCVVAETGTNSGTPSIAPTKMTHPLDSNVEISPSLAIILACLVLILMAGVFIYIRRMSPDSFDESFGFHFLHHRPTVSRGLDPEIIKTFPVFLYSDVKALKLGKSILECAVCLNEFEDEETLRLLPNCYHVFHPECIDAWLAFRTTCPVCRINLKTKPIQQTGALEYSQDMSHPDTERSSETVIDIQVSNVGPQEIVRPSPQRSSPSNNILNCSTVTTKTADFRHVAPKSTPRRTKILGMFSRSHSTGHSLIQPGQNIDRFTLKLPDDARKRLVELSLSRTYNVEPLSLERSSTKGYRFEPETGRFKFLSTPTLLSEPGSSNNMLKTVKSVKSPLSLLCGTEKADDTGERSFTYLRSSPSS
ncbi:E3 ubiquitin-protein ligase ATL6-like [Capsicum chacoense]